MQQLNIRQQKILDFITQSGKTSNAEIIKFLGNEISRFTVLRDLDLLLKASLIKKEGEGRAIRYAVILKTALDSFFDPKIYFQKGPDERIIKTDFDESILNNLSQVFSREEIDSLENINTKYLKKIKNDDQSFIKKEIERLTIDLSWKSSHIEGNTYSLIDTEMIIKQRIEAKGHDHEEAIMILNHNNAINYIFENKEEFKNLDLFHIEKIHELLTIGLGVNKGVRNGPVRITGTRYTPIEGKTEIIRILQNTIDVINSIDDAFSKSLATILMISYLQPFEDGNKRTSRILGNAILLANNKCPLSYRSISETDYKNAIVIFYEQNSARFLKQLFMEQFRFAVDTYF